MNHLREFIAGNIGIECPGFNLNTVIGFAVSEACVKMEMENLKELAGEGSVYAQFHLSRVFRGLSNLDVDQAFWWVKISAEQDYAPSQYSLAVMYSRGEGIDRDLNEEFQWVKRSAEQGYVPAQRKLAVMYAGAEGVDRDLDQAFHWMRRSAEQGYAPAQHDLAVMYAGAEGVDRDLDQAFHWMRRSAEQGYTPAQHILNVAHSFVIQSLFKQLQNRAIGKDDYSYIWSIWTSHLKKKNSLSYSKTGEK